MLISFLLSSLREKVQFLINQFYFQNCNKLLETVALFLMQNHCQAEDTLNQTFFVALVKGVVSIYRHAL